MAALGGDRWGRDCPQDLSRPFALLMGQSRPRNRICLHRRKSWGFPAGGVSVALVCRAFLMMGLGAEPARAQTFRGTILGTVTDSSGAAVANAKVTVRNVDTGVDRSPTPTPTGVHRPRIADWKIQGDDTSGWVSDIGDEGRGGRRGGHSARGRCAEAWRSEIKLGCGRRITASGDHYRHARRHADSARHQGSARQRARLHEIDLFDSGHRRVAGPDFGFSGIIRRSR